MYKNRRRGLRARAPHHPINQAHPQPRGASLELHHEHIAEVLGAGAGAGGLSRSFSSSLTSVSWVGREVGGDKESVGLEASTHSQSQDTEDLWEDRDVPHDRAYQVLWSPRKTPAGQTQQQAQGRDRPTQQDEFLRSWTQCTWAARPPAASSPS